ncbi:MFS transporter [Streptomonospora nanhaiensis]|uniref:Putative proline/betaine transporter n=1 Tax=Streptomonospora nanhaiensis TaxID=1323731 RepID=A0A853BMY5_9ACTN|nr:MFS transporter [Streptomonospora nanhaiensis]MBV2366097.1 MHS family MFS transporter [Streptomonospora nanhaiensis]MBX9391430.1 MHS family MFS transporter [Streptomonospora nanhaiensis]NYI96573.1 MFS family permease [Streptomonospora nanhaiensis]
MTAHEGAPAPDTTGPTPPEQMRRVVLASLVGTALEWYDFFIYGTAAALVFNTLFFTDADPAVGTLVAFASFAVGFVFRPLGGFVFGHIGDRFGRRTTLVITTLIMGVSTGLIGLLPTYPVIGIWAPVLLTLLRVCQGLGAGAEFGGASTLLSEHAPPARRGYYGSYAQTGVQIGLVMGTVVFLLVGFLPDEALYSWGWRLPFLLSFLLIGVSLYLRLRVAESPVFLRAAANRTTVKVPILRALTRYPGSFLVGIGAHIADTAVVYIYATFSVSYLTATLDQPRWVALTGVIAFGVAVILLQPVYGALSDRIGRRPVNLFSVVFTALFAYPFFFLLNTGEPVVIWLALLVATTLGLAPMIAVQPAFYAELFGAGVRYTGFAASREIGAAIAGFSPVAASFLLEYSGGDPWLVALMMVGACAVSLVAFLFSRETREIDISAFETSQGSIVGTGRARSGGAG